MHDWKKRGVYFAFGILAIPLGLASRYVVSLPSFFAAHAGDAFWTVLVYCAIGFCVPRSTIVTRAAMTLGFACAVEFSQLYHAPWIDSVRETTLGGLVLGFQFVWVDLLRYTAGVMICVTVEAGAMRIGSE